MQGFLPGVECHARPLPWTTGVSGHPLTHSSFLYLQRRECPDPPARFLHTREKALHLMCVVTDRRTGSEVFSEEIRTFKSKMEG